MVSQNEFRLLFVCSFRVYWQWGPLKISLLQYAADVDYKRAFYKRINREILCYSSEQCRWYLR